MTVHLDLPAPWRAAELDAVADGRLDVTGLADPEGLAPVARTAREHGGRLLLVCPLDDPTAGPVSRAGASGGPGSRSDAAAAVVAVAVVRPPIAPADLDDLVREARSGGIGARLGDLDGVRIACFVHRADTGSAGSFLHVNYLLPLEDALILLACSALAGPSDRQVAGHCARLLASVRLDPLVPARPPLR